MLRACDREARRDQVGDDIKTEDAHGEFAWRKLTDGGECGAAHEQEVAAKVALVGLDWSHSLRKLSPQKFLMKS